jgi:hypothetical protein
MRDLIRKIIKEESATQTNLLFSIEKMGIKQTIKMFGGYNKFNKVFPNYFYSKDESDEDESNEVKFNKDRAIDLINELVEEHRKVADGPIDIYELIGQDYTLYTSIDDEGNDVVTYLSSIDTDSAGYYVYMYDADSGEMYDEPIEEGYLKLRHFEDSVLNDIFEMFVDKFL